MQSRYPLGAMPLNGVNSVSSTIRPYGPKISIETSARLRLSSVHTNHNHTLEIESCHQVVKAFVLLSYQVFSYLEKGEENMGIIPGKTKGPGHEMQYQEADYLLTRKAYSPMVLLQKSGFLSHKLVCQQVTVPHARVVRG